MNLVNLSALKKTIPRAGISQRLFWFTLIVTFSLSITCGAVNCFLAYQDAWHSLEQTLTGIKHSQVPGVSYHVCNRQTDRLVEQARAILQLPHIISVTITDGRQELAREGSADGYKSVLTRKYPLICFSSDQKAITGMLTVTASGDYINEQACSGFLIACAKNAALLLLLAGAMLFYLHGSFVQPIKKITLFTRDLGPEHMQAALVLNRRISSAPDEIDGLAAALNSLREKLLEHALTVKENKSALNKNFDHVFNIPGRNLALLSPNRDFLRANQAFCRMLGISEPELLQLNWAQVLHPDEVQHDIENFHQLKAGGPDIFTRQARFATIKDGSASASLTVYCMRSPEGPPECYGVELKDTTGGSSTEMQLQMLTAAVEKIDEIVVITDTDSIIQFVNPAFSRATGYESADVLGKTPAILQSGKHDTGFYKTLWATIGQGDVWRGRFINKKQNGELYDEEASIYPVRNEAGIVTNYLAVKHDITHDLKIEHRLRQVQKIEAIGTLAGGIAHDFNNILGVIYGYAEMSLDEQETLPEIRNNLQQVISATNRAKDLIRQILTISRQTEKEALPVTISPIAKEVIKFIRASLPSSITIKQSFQAKNDLLLADPIQIHQLLMNLCTNAGHAMKDRSGIMEISLKNLYLTEADIQPYPFMLSGEYLCLSVADTGCGISAENIEHIFEPYFTTKEFGEGTGLGLAVVHGIVRNCGGDIRVYSEVDKGSVFNVYLPLISRRAEKPSEPELEIPRGTEHIMFVDDELSLVKTSKIILERLGYRVTVQTSSREALATFMKTPDTFDMLITDKTMPDLSGFDLVREMQAIRPDMPVILCTGVSAKTDMERVHELGISGLLLKPFNKQELAGMIRDILDHTTSQIVS